MTQPPSPSPALPPTFAPGRYASDPEAPKPLLRIGSYLVEEELGRGGMGKVLRVRHVQTGAPYAIKLILGAGVDAESLERFRREAVLLARLEHPGIVRVHSLDATEDGTPFLVMELVAGESLGSRLERETRLAPTEAARIVAGAARAIGHSHRHGVLHRDLKPANILLDARDGRPRVLDFGLAFDQALTRLTKTGISVGTPAYMAPEQVDEGSAGAPVGPATDVYALGAILYALLTGRPPHDPNAPIHVLLLAILDSEPPRPRSIVPDLPERLEAICVGTLQRRAADRPESADALADALEAWLRGSEVDTPSALERRGGGRGLAVGVAALVIAAAVAAYAILDPGGGPSVETIESDVAHGRIPDEAAVTALEADPEVDTPEGRRRRVVALLARLAREADVAPGSPAIDDVLDALPAAVRPDGKIDEALLESTTALLVRALAATPPEETGGPTAWPLRALDRVLHGAAPVATASPKIAKHIGPAMAARGSTLRPPEDEAAFEALLDGVRPGVQAGLHRARGEARARALFDAPGRDPADGWGAAQDDLLRALELDATEGRVALAEHDGAPIAWPAAFHRRGLERLRKLHASGERDPDEAIERLGALLIHIPGDAGVIPPEEVLALQSLTPELYGMRELPSLDRDDLRQAITTGAILYRYGLTTSPQVTSFRLKSKVEILRDLARGEADRPPETRNAARLLLLTELVIRRIDARKTEERDEIRSWIPKAIEAAAGRRWAHAHAADLLDVWGVSAALPDAVRAAELDRRSEDRWSVAAQVAAGLLVSGERNREGYDPSHAARLIREAARIALDRYDWSREVTSGGGYAPVVHTSWYKILRTIWAVADHLTLSATDDPKALKDFRHDDPRPKADGPRPSWWTPCCAEEASEAGVPFEGPDVDELLDLGIELHDREAIEAALKLDRDRHWFMRAFLHAARARHERRHGRWDAAIEAYEAAIADAEALATSTREEETLRLSGIGTLHEGVSQVHAKGGSTEDAEHHAALAREFSRRSRAAKEGK